MVLCNHDRGVRCEVDVAALLRAAQTGFAQNYALVMVLGLMIGVMAFVWFGYRQRLFGTPPVLSGTGLA